jgi:mRNA interferase MazF
LVTATATPAQGEIWWAETNGKRRPVLVVTRTVAVPVLTAVLVAPITRTVRSIPTEIALGPDQGLTHECAATFDNLQPIRRTMLTTRIGELSLDQLDEICRALNALADC